MRRLAPHQFQGLPPPRGIDLEADFIETLRRCVLATLLEQNQALLKWKDWGAVAARTDGGAFQFATTAQALAQFQPIGAEICNVVSDPRWHRRGGTRGYLPQWRAAVADLLARFETLRAPFERVGGRMRIGAPFLIDDEPDEQKLCAMQRVLEAMQEDPQRLYSAAFWRDTLANAPAFWEVWWGTALGNLGVQADEDAPPPADAPRRIDCLCEAAKALYAGRPSDCLRRLDDWLYSEAYDDTDEETASWMDTTPAFLYAVDCLKLGAHVAAERARYAAGRDRALSLL
jgi:hypothetical protein